MIETRELPVVAEPTTPIKPSEALRLGRLIYPHDNPYSQLVNGTTACALGAMLAGWGIDPNDDNEDMTVATAALTPFGLKVEDVYRIYDRRVWSPEDDGAPSYDPAADRAVLAYLEERGL